MKKLYVVVRRDLPWPQRCVQAIHAATNLAYDLGLDNDPYWGEIGPNVILYGADDRHQLERWDSLDPTVFHEPDMNDEATAIAAFVDGFNPKGMRLL